MRKREILEFAFPQSYQKKLNSEGWSWLEKTFDESIGKLTEVKLEISLQIREKTKTAKNAKAIKELQEKIGGQRKKGTKGKNKNQDVTKSNGPKDKNSYYLCDTCGKTYKGLYCKLKNITQQPSQQGDNTSRN